MARKAKSNETEADHLRVASVADVQKVSAEAERMQGLVRDYAQQLGQHMKIANKSYNIHIQALKQANRLKAMGVLRAAEYIAHLNYYCESIGAVQQDMFGGRADELREDGKRREPSQKKDNVMELEVFREKLEENNLKVAGE